MKLRTIDDMTVSRLDRQRGYMLYRLLQFAIVAMVMGEVIFRLTGSSLVPLAAQALILSGVIVLCPIKSRLKRAEVFFLLAMTTFLAIYFVRDVFDQGRVTTDAIGNILRCIAFARLLFSARMFEMTEKQILKLSLVTVLICLATVVVLRLENIQSSIRVEPVVLSYAVGLYQLRHARKKGWGIGLTASSLIVLMIAEKASLLLAAVGVTLFLFPFAAVVTGLVMIVLLPNLSSLLQWLVHTDALGRFTIRLVLLLDLLQSFDRTLLALVTSNRSEEYFFVFGEWQRDGFPIFGSGLSASIFIEQIDEERSTFHNLYLNLVRVFGVPSILLYVGLILVVVRAVRLSRLVGAVIFGLLLHNLLTFSLLQSPLMYLLLLYAPRDGVPVPDDPPTQFFTSVRGPAPVPVRLG